MRHGIKWRGINNKKGPRKTLKVNGVLCDFLLDTVASVNVLDQSTHVKIGSPILERETNQTLLPYGGGKQLTVLGSCWLQIEWKGSVQTLKFYVVKGSYGALLGYQTCISFGLIQVVNQLSSTADKFSNLFVGVGKLEDRKVSIHIDETVKPVAQRTRRTPFHLRPKVEAELTSKTSRWWHNRASKGRAYTLDFSYSVCP